jgi:hypothetical protein
MNRIFRHLLMGCITATTAFSQDTIVFKNGDVLTGTILKQDAEHVQFSSESFGSVSLNTADIAKIRTEAPTATTTDQPAAQQPVAEAALGVKPGGGKNSTTASADSAAEILEQMAEAGRKATTIQALEAKAPPQAPSKWTGQAGLAIAMREKTDSNSTGIYREDEFRTYRLYGNINWKGEKNNLNWKWTYRYSEDETRKRDDYVNLTQKYNHNLKGGYYAETKTVYQSDYNRNIDDEFLQTAEIGKKWYQLPRFKFSTSVGGGYHIYERSLPGETTRTSEPKFIFDESLEWKLINSLTLFQKYTHLGDLEAYHFIFSSGLENRLIRDVFLRLEYRLDRDTDTVYDGKGYYDKALLTSLLYKF